MDSTIVRGLCDKLYEKRKNAAHELEGVIKECYKNKDETRIVTIINQLVEIFNAPGNALHSRNGGLIGLAATGIALGVDMFQYADIFLEPLLSCFADPEARIRYFACESMYNLCKCVKGEVLVYFNPIFDALSRLAADPDASVQNGADMVNLMLRDIVAECAAVYVPKYEPSDALQRQYEEEYYTSGVVISLDSSLFAPERKNGDTITPVKHKAFSLPRFMPLLAERIQVLNSLTRSFLVQWITLLDSVPDLELVTYLPSILEGLFSYLADPASDDVRVPTANLLSDFLREIRTIAELERGTSKAHKRKKSQAARVREAEREAERSMSTSSALSDSTAPGMDSSLDATSTDKLTEEDRGAYVPGQGVRVDYAAIVEILLRQVQIPREEVIRHTALNWLSQFLEFAEDVMLPFTPRLIAVILGSFADESKSIHHVAVVANNRLHTCIQKLPTPPMASTLPPIGSSASSMRNMPATSPGATATTQPLTRVMSKATLSESSSDPSTSVERASTTVPPPSNLPVGKSRTNTVQSTASGTSVDSYGQETTAPASTSHSRPESPNSMVSVPLPAPMVQSLPTSDRSVQDPFDYQTTVIALTECFIREHDETKIAALKWLMMLHQKAPGKILAIDDGTFPLLLKILSDTSSESVVKYDLQLLAQISSSSEEGYFRSFMQNLLELFSTDRRLLDSRGGLIVRQLCVSLGAERIYRTFSEFLEKEEDLEFASVIVQKLNLILITTPEMADCRKRLKTVEGQSFFTALYRSWCHNPVSAFALCLLAQAYEHASNLLLMFADLEITVHLLVQIDRLVQLIESPVFTYLRLQLLEPDKNPYLFKCLYGLLMTLPQSSAFVSLRNRLNAVSSMGFLHIAPRTTTLPSPPVPASARSKMTTNNKEEIKWQDLLTHFRVVQAKHEKARRQESGGGDGPFASSFTSSNGVNGAQPMRPNPRRRSTNETAASAGGPPRDFIPAARPPPMALALSPLNPRARGAPALPALIGNIASATGTSPNTMNRPMSPTMAQMKAKAAASGRR
ncbi:ARM repeat-containing protein [Auriculariales sp. MPI-PUGE-AT-0066]|nr:ARM repeat-containing protein [Auriculariales sp. MPI-PUGE-AT-0066]